MCKLGRVHPSSARRGRHVAQSASGRARIMSCLFLIVVLAVHSQAYVTDPPSFAKRLDRLYEKIERFNLAQSEPVRMEDKLNAKLAKLNALTPVRLGDEDEELVSTMQLWGDMSEDQVRDVMRELQRMKEQRPEDKVDRLEGEYGDSDWNDEVSG